MPDCDRENGDSAGERKILRHWHHIMYWLMFLCGLVYSLGIQRAQIITCQERQLALEKANIEMISSFQSMRDNVSRLQWDRDLNNKTVNEIQIDVRTLLRSVMEQGNQQKVILELLKPATKADK
jgi:hypothetical protein